MPSTTVFILFSMPLLVWLTLSVVTLYVSRSPAAIAATALTLSVCVWMIHALRDEHNALIFFGCLWGWMLISAGGYGVLIRNSSFQET